MPTPQHCPGFDQFRDLKSITFKCPNCGAEVEIFSDEYDKTHVCPSCKQKIEFSKAEIIKK